MYNKQYGPMNLVCISVDWNVSIFYGSHVKKLICILALGLLWVGNAIAEECVQGNCKNGQGTYTWSDGQKYVGEFKDDKREGQGTFTFANGKIKEGIWENDKLVREKSEIVRYEKIYNKCILENLKGQSDKEVTKIIKDACKNKASDPSVFDKLFN